MVRGPEDGGRPAARAWRATPWRADATRRFPHPRATLTAQHSLELARDWTQNFGQNTQGRYQKLRASLAKWAFGGEAANSLFRRGKNDPQEYRLPREALLEHLAGQLPTYLPQVADFDDLVLLTPPVLPADHSFVAKTADLIARQGERALSVVLAPALQADYRRELLKELRRRGAAGGVIDDLDLCRLLNPGGRQPDPVLGLLEIALEQQKWGRLSPFSPDKAHARLAMYVGRVEEARELASSPRWARLFSGRKLGKTALLKSLEQKWDGKELPSGLKLRVLYLSIVGVQAEADLINRAVEQVRMRLDFRADDLVREGSTAETLLRFLGRFLDERPDESLLFVLDDADEFVLAQLEEYEQNKDNCLSCRLRTELLPRQDDRQLPRVRFLFSGYKATATYGGPWAHWGDVLQLGPLLPDEAVDLIAGPLARLGIDATAQADAIAFRCGYQPAVILRFGEELLRRLEGRYGYREGLVVSAEDVAETFHQQAVQDEVRMVVSYNFQGNALGRAVFAALLLELAALPPGRELLQADEKVLERLRAIEPDLSWLPADENSARGQVAGQLKDFVKRQLVVERQRHGEPAYALRFPYHLSVLLAIDQEAEARQAIQALRGGGSAAPGARISGLLPARAMQDLLEVVRLEPSPEGLTFRAAVVGTHWPQGVNHRSGGVPNRVGIDPAHVCSPAEAVLPERATRPQLAVLNAGPADLEAVLQARPTNLPAPLLTGGADLLRDVLWRARKSDETFEAHGLGRLSLPILRWWFKRVRCLELAHEEADLLAIHEKTAGIPFLVRIVDELLVPPTAGEGGMTVSAEAMQEALAKFDERLTQDAGLLESGPPEVRLTERELELLRMIQVASAANDFRAEVSLAAALGEEWELYAEAWEQAVPGRPQPAPLTDAAEDQVALEMVQLLGLVPTEPDRPTPPTRLRPPEREGPLPRLLGRLAGARSPTETEG